MTDDGPAIQKLAFVDLLSVYPPGTMAVCADALKRNHHGSIVFKSPELLLWCDAKECQRPMLFECEDTGYVKEKQWAFSWFRYKCKHCESRLKAFSIVAWAESETECFITKAGEWPAFAPRLPARVLRLVQNDVALMKQGRRAEAMNLGIGAFAYYRRVVERQKNHLFDAIISAAEKVNATPTIISTLQSAKNNFQFTQSLDELKAAVPESLLISGQNPLTLLHKALSAGIHNDSDEDCLQLAADVRVVLVELAERISSILREQGELDEAVTRLLQRKHEKSKETK
jgi:hypothetical protein